MNEYDYMNLSNMAISINDEFTKNTFLETIRRYDECLKELQKKDNIINELEKWLNDVCLDPHCEFEYRIISQKLKELKEGKE